MDLQEDLQEKSQNSQYPHCKTVKKIITNKWKPFFPSGTMELEYV